MRARSATIGLAMLAVSGLCLLGIAQPRSQAADTASTARPPRIVVTIKPIHSLAAALLAGIAEPVLLVEGQASPHSFTLKPSATRAANEADVLVRVSPAVEPFTERLLATLPPSVDVVTLATLPAVHLLDVRSGDTFEAHDHGAARRDHTGHGPGAGKTGTGRQHAHDHDHHEPGGRSDGHIWLDPGNARAIVAALAATFTRHAPAEAQRIASNAAALDQRITALDTQLGAELEPVRGRPFIVFHDAYQYFEHRFGLEAAGAMTLSPEVQPSARRLSALRRRIADLGPACVFAEPQFQGGIIAAVTEGTSARAGVLDPEGATLTPGPELYFELMRKLATGMRACLASLPAP